MKTLNQNPFVKLLLAILLILALSGCGQIVTESNFTLDEEKPIPGTLLILSQNATLTSASSVEGSVIMLCCNLIVEGEVKGDVFLLTGNLMINADANVTGNGKVISGNISQK